MTNTILRNGEKVRVVNSWLPDNLKNKTATILGFQKNGKNDYAIVKWCKAEYGEIAGTIFPLDELRKV